MGRIKVLYTHQGTLPSYRMGLVKALIKSTENSDTHHFSFVFDKKVNEHEKLGNPDVSEVAENLTLVNTFYLAGIIKLQGWLPEALKSDVIIIENCLNNLTNILLLGLNIFFRKRIIVLGHDDFSFYNKRTFSGPKAFLWNTFGHGFLFYTFLENSSNKSITIPRDYYNNFNDEVDVELVKKSFSSRDSIRKQLGVSSESKVALYVGRMDKTKGFDGDFCDIIAGLSNSQGIHFVFIGFSKEEFIYSNLFDSAKTTYLPFISNPAELTDYFIAADIYFHPGTIGLGPIRAIQHGLRPICFGRKQHNPEVAYCDARNTIFINRNEDLEWAFSQALMESSSLDSRLSVIDTLSWLSNDISSSRIRRFIQQIANPKDHILPV